MVVETSAVVALLKDPLKMVKSLYSWCGWAASVLAITSVGLAQRPTDVASQVLGTRIGLPFDVTSTAATSRAVLVACIALLALPVFATFRTGWDDIGDAQMVAWRRAGPPSVTFWLALLFAAESGPLNRAELEALFHHAAGDLWSWASVPVYITLVPGVGLHVAWFVTRFSALGHHLFTGIEVFWRAIASLLTCTLLMFLAVFLVAVMPLLLLGLFVFGLGEDRDGAPPPRGLTPTASR